MKMARLTLRTLSFVSILMIGPAVQALNLRNTMRSSLSAKRNRFSTKMCLKSRMESMMCKSNSESESKIQIYPLEGGSSAVQVLKGVRDACSHCRDFQCSPGLCYAGPCPSGTVSSVSKGTSTSDHSESGGSSVNPECSSSDYCWNPSPVNVKGSRFKLCFASVSEGGHGLTIANGKVTIDHSSSSSSGNQEPANQHVATSASTPTSNSVPPAGPPPTNVDSGSNANAVQSLGRLRSSRTSANNMLSMGPGPGSGSANGFDPRDYNNAQNQNQMINYQQQFQRQRMMNPGNLNQGQNFQQYNNGAGLSLSSSSNDMNFNQNQFDSQVNMNYFQGRNGVGPAVPGSQQQFSNYNQAQGPGNLHFNRYGPSQYGFQQQQPIYPIYSGQSASFSAGQ